MSYRVLCAYDGSASADKAFEFSLTLTTAFRGELYVLAVVHPPEPPEDIETEAFLESGQERVQQEFGRLKTRAAGAGVNCDFRVAVGHPAEQILYLADEVRVDHIVLGHRGKNAFKRWLMGSVSHRVISYAPSAVTVIR